MMTMTTIDTDEMPVTLQGEVELFNRAKAMVITRSDTAGGIEAILDLAYRARHLKMREWAAHFLRDRMGLEIVEIDDEAATKTG